MSSSRILREVTHIASLGLAQKEVRIIKDLITISKELVNGFDYSDKADLMTADILFISTDNKIAMELYAKHRAKLDGEPIFVHRRTSPEGSVNYDLSQYPNATTLGTPFKLVELKNILLNTVSTPVLYDNPGLALSMKANCFKMLVIDDSFPVRKYLEQKLPELMAEINPNLDFNIQYASSGRDAVNKVKAARGAYDIAFLDIMMGDIDGYKICKWIKRVKRSINVVMLTSKTSPIDRVRANMSGCDSYLSKPPKDSHLRKVILKHRRFNNMPLDRNRNP